MITLKLKYRKKEKEVTLRHRNEIDEGDILEDTGEQYSFAFVRDKWIRFEDGSELYTKVRSVTRKAFITEAGVYKRGDYYSPSRIQYPFTNYSGARRYDEHKLSRPYRRKEYLLAGQFIKTNNKVSLTPRMRMIVKDRLNEIAEDHGIDADWIIGKLKKEAENMRSRGADRIEAIKLLARTRGAELERQTHQVTMNQPLFQQINGGTIQEQRRIQKPPSRKELKGILDATGVSIMEDREKDNFINGDTEKTLESKVIDVVEGKDGKYRTVDNGHSDS